jgi:hypothetical protein
VIIDGIKFDSKREAARYSELVFLEKAGNILFLERQVPFVLQDKFEYQGEKIREIKYIADFIYIEDGKKIIEDVKSWITQKRPDYKIKVKLLKKRYPTYIFREVL